jgi:putative flippase GtrA
MQPLLKEVSYVPRYIFVGLITLAVDTTVFKLALGELGAERHLLALSIAVVCAYVINFLGHKLITFAVLNDARRQLSWHLPMKLCVYSLRLGIMYVFVEKFGFSVYISYGTGLCLGIVTFLGSRWIFTGSNPLELLVLVRFWAPIVLQRIRVRLRR